MRCCAGSWSPLPVLSHHVPPPSPTAASGAADLVSVGRDVSPGPGWALGWALSHPPVLPILSSSLSQPHPSLLGLLAPGLHQCWPWAAPAAEQGPSGGDSTLGLAVQGHAPRGVRQLLRKITLSWGVGSTALWGWPCLGVAEGDWDMDAGTVGPSWPGGHGTGGVGSGQGQWWLCTCPAPTHAPACPAAPGMWLAALPAQLRGRGHPGVLPALPSPRQLLARQPAHRPPVHCRPPLAPSPPSSGQ